MVDFVVNIINFLIACIGKILSVIFSILPSSPFTIIDNSPISKFLGYINYFVPFDEVVNILQIWILCVGGYYIYQVALRWIKAIN